MKKISVKLCAGCVYRSEKHAFNIHLCDYAVSKRECRKDPEGFCSHYTKDKSCTEEEIKKRVKMAKIAREKWEILYAQKQKKRDRKRSEIGRPRKDVG